MKDNISLLPKAENVYYPKLDSEPWPVKRLTIVDFHGVGRAPGFAGIIDVLHPGTSITAVGAEQAPPEYKHPHQFMIDEMVKYNVDISGLPVRKICQNDLVGTDLISFVPPKWLNFDLNKTNSITQIYFADPWESALEASQRNGVVNKPTDVNLRIAISLACKELTNIAVGRLTSWIHMARNKNLRSVRNGVLETLNVGYFYRAPISKGSDTWVV